MTGNPALNENTFTTGQIVPGAQTMTVQGAVYKTILLLLLTVGAASFTWSLHYSGNDTTLPVLTGGGALAGFIIAMVTIFKKEWAAFTSPLYAICEGLFLGGISATFSGYYNGVAIQAAMLTFGILAALLAAYTTGLVRATDRFKRGVIAATGGIAILYLATFILGFFHIQMPMIYSSGAVGIIFSLAVVVIASMNLIIDFDFIEQGAAVGAPKYLEWYAAFSLLVTLLWLYLEILRLLMKMNRRN